jgi:hypothetical protein
MRSLVRVHPNSQVQKPGELEKEMREFLGRPRPASRPSGGDAGEAEAAAMWIQKMQEGF